MANLIAGVVELIIGLFCSVQQMNTTHDSVVSALQGGTLISSHLTGPQLLTVLNGNLDKFNKIGWMVAWVTQTVFWTTIMPKSPITRLGISKVVVGIFFICEITTDVWYSIATGTTLDGVFAFVFTTGITGIAGSILYVIAMATGSIILLVDGFHRLETVWGQLASNKKSGSRRAAVE